MRPRPRAPRIPLVAQISCCAFLHVGAIVVQDAAPHPDHNLIQGYWRETRTERHGKQPAFSGGSRILLKGKLTGKLSLVGATSGKYVIRPDESPKEIDITGRKGQVFSTFADEKYARYGIYQVDLCTLTICESPTERPTQFRTSPKLDWVLRKYRRVVWETDPDLDIIAGKWRIAKSAGKNDFRRAASRVRRRDGCVQITKKSMPQFMKIPPPVGFPRAEIETIRETVGHFRDGAGKELSSFKIRLDSTQSPKSIRLSPGGDGIYRLDGNTLTIKQRRGYSWYVLLER